MLPLARWLSPAFRRLFWRIVWMVALLGMRTWSND